MSNESIAFLLIMAPIYLFIYLLTYHIQAISSKDFFYGVYVKNVNLDEKDKIRINKGYKKRINLLFLLVLLVSIACGIISMSWIMVVNVGLLVFVFISYIYLRKYFIEVKNLKIKYLEQNQELKESLTIEKRKVAIDTIFLNEKVKLQTKFKRLFAICISLSLAALVYQIVSYPNLPDTIITHWGVNGEPDGFSPKTIVNVFFMSFIDISVVLLLSFITIESLGAKLYLDTTNLEANRRNAIKYLNGMGYSFFFLTLGVQSMTTTTPIFMINEIPIPSVLILLSIVFPIIICGPMIYFYMKLSSVKSNEKYINTNDSDDDNWIYGFIYYNKNDPAFMVEKRFGIGWSMNMANVKAIIFVILILLITVIPLIIAFV